MKLLLVTGMSGAGKSVALKTLEDAGFEAIDNLPLAFLPAVAAAGTRDLAVGWDIRGRDFSIDHLRSAIGPLKGNSTLDFKILFLDCDDEALRRRFTETRRRHPLALDRTVTDGIRHERSLVEGLRDLADLVIDTSDLTASELRESVSLRFARQPHALSITLTSFAFRRGIPREADMVFDVRFLKNPHYDPALRDLTGLDAAVGKAVEADKGFADFYGHLTALLLPLLPRYLEEGKHYLTIAIGCTGGRHRSVYLVQKLGDFLRARGYKADIRHRDLEIDK